MIKSNKIPAAFIFEGENASVTSMFADNLARAVVCSDTRHKKEHGTACNACASCAKAVKSIHPDIIMPESDGGALSFHIDKVRDIINGLYLSPNESDAKIYIIKDMQNMTPQGQNALLKSLEEPPPFVFFIITVNNSDLILETVKSRAVRFNTDSAGDPAKKNAPRNYGGLILDILTENPDKAAVYQKLLSSVSDKSEVLNFYSHIENALRDILIAKIFMAEFAAANGAPETLRPAFLYFGDFEDIKKMSNLYTAKKILDLSKKIHKYKADLDYNINIKLNLTSFFSNFSNFSSV
jgi:hypothetical protein